MIGSGFRRGSDVLKALALGADADIIFKELVDAAAATGKTSMASIDASIVMQ